jgi:hypothetical protein
MMGEIIGAVVVALAGFGLPLLAVLMWYWFVKWMYGSIRDQRYPEDFE